jgi:RNA polymerase sigma-70 factor (ECF subfamily)
MDAEEFKNIFLPYHQKLFGIAFRIVGNERDAEDLLQDTYTKLWIKRDIFAEINNAESFAVTTLKNTCLDFLRRAKNTFHREYDYTVPEKESLSTSLENRDQVDLILLLMKDLPEQQRRVMQLKHWDGYSDKEIEEITGLTTVNIKTILSRTRRKIKEQFMKTESR